MSHYARGVLDGVTHYCDAVFKELRPWCKPYATRIFATKSPSKKALVNCLRCLWLRKQRP